MRNLAGWLGAERREILDRRAAIAEAFEGLAPHGWSLEGSGAYFAYVRHPFATPSDALAPALVQAAGILCLPGTMFSPAGEGTRHLRLAFANIDRAGIAALAARLAALTEDDVRVPPLAPAGTDA
jgi:aspartate/methionine/tyrosine aminotransferase